MLTFQTNRAQISGYQSIEQIGCQEYPELLKQALYSGINLGVNNKDFDNTWQLIEELHDFDPSTAKDSLQVLPIATCVGRVIFDYYDGVELDEQALWSASLLHDIGKTKINHDLVLKSNTDCDWTEDDRSKMAPHAIRGGIILKARGYCNNVVRPVEDHHAKQLGYSYGSNRPFFTNPERLIRDCVTIADFSDAAINRCNRRSGKTPEQRKQLSREHIRYVLNDYKDAPELTEVVIDRLGLATTN
jgi:putative nucleotidyltransferase with HDIG domain